MLEIDGDVGRGIVEPAQFTEHERAITALAKLDAQYRDFLSQHKTELDELEERLELT